MRCYEVQSLLSARMDGEFLSGAERRAVEAHVPGCAECRRFDERAALVRTAVRIRPAEPVPDLTEAILARVAREHPPVSSLVRPRRRRLTTSVAAALVGALVGSLLVGGPWDDRGSFASAAAVRRAVRAAAVDVDSFDGTYAIHERGLSPDVPERDLSMRIAYLAPQRFRLEVMDTTAYPSEAWTPTDLVYVEDVPATYRSGPTGCPGDLPVGVCPPTRTTVTRTHAYSAAAPLPADLVTPVTTLSEIEGIRVVGEEQVDGHDTVRVEMAFDRAAPLFPFLRLGGTWRHFYEGDRVVVWLDTDGWFPVRYRVFPSADAERDGWESRFGLSHEPADEAILDVTLTSLAAEPPDASSFAISGVDLPDTLSLDEAVARLGYVPSTPEETSGLELVTVLLPPTSSPIGPRSVLLYASGLEYLRVGEDPMWGGPGPLGPVSAGAEQVRLADGVSALYEASSDGFGRRVAIEGADTALYLESNLPRDELLAVAASLPIEGRS